MKKLLMNIAIIFSLIALISNNSFSQLTEKWEYADSVGFRVVHFALYINRNFTYVNENDILIFGFNDDAILRYYTNTSGKKDSVNTTIFRYKLIKYSNYAEQKEVIYFDSTQNDDNWNSMAHPSENVIAIVGDSVSYLGRYDWGAYKYHSLLILSIDAGKTWQRKIMDSNAVFRSISMYDSSNGIIYQDSWPNYFNNFRNEKDTILITNDCWQSYRKVALPPNTRANLVYCIKPDNFLVYSEDPDTWEMFFYISTNGGESWVLSQKFNEKIAILDLKFIDDKTAFACGKRKLDAEGFYTEPVIFKSNDGGINWVEHKNLFFNNLKLDEYSRRDPFLYSIDFNDKLNGIVSGFSMILRTRDGGDSWTIEYPPPYIRYIGDLKRIIYPKKDFAFAYTGNSNTIKWRNKKILSSPSFYEILNKYYRPVENINVEWTKILGANSYHLKIFDKPSNIDNYDFEKPLIDTLIADTSLILNKLNYNYVYIGTIQSIGDNTESDWSYNSLLFYTIKEESAFIPPGLIYPSNLSSVPIDKVTLIWQKINNATSYYIKVKNYSNGYYFYRNDNYIDTTLTLTNFESYTLYQVLLSSVYEDGISNENEYFFYANPEITNIIEYSNIKNNELYIFPNPVIRNCYIKINSEANQLVIIKIYNLMGNEMRQMRVNLITGENFIPIDAGYLSAGLYCVQIITGGDTLSGLFIKE